MAVIKSPPGKFPLVVGDQLTVGSIFSANASKIPALTPKFAASIAQFQDLESFKRPMLQVVGDPNMKFEVSSSSGRTNSSHFTHICVRDGTKDVMTGCLSVHLVHGGNSLDVGGIIELDRFTHLTYRLSGRDLPHRSPVVVIHTYCKLGYAAVPKNERPNSLCRSNPGTDDQGSSH